MQKNKTNKKASKAKAKRASRKIIDNAQTLKLIARAKKAGVNMKAATSVVRYIRSLGFGASNQVIAEMLNSKRAYM